MAALLRAAAKQNASAWAAMARAGHDEFRGNCKRPAKGSGLSRSGYGPRRYFSHSYPKPKKETTC